MGEFEFPDYPTPTPTHRWVVITFPDSQEITCPDSLAFPNYATCHHPGWVVGMAQEWWWWWWWVPSPFSWVVPVWVGGGWADGWWVWLG